jgi:hypothetical protein
MRKIQSSNIRDLNSLSLPLPSTQEYMRDNKTLFNSGLFKRPNLYSIPHAQYLTYDSESLTQETTVRTLSNGSGPTTFGVCMKKL